MSHTRTCEFCGSDFRKREGELPYRFNKRRFCDRACSEARWNDRDARIAAFWARVEKTPACWLWKGSLNQGYGQFAFRKKIVRAHRFAYELLVGPIPDRLTLDHLCRVRACVNPDHLEPVTDRENILRGTGLSARNAARTHCKRGHLFDEANTYNNGRRRRCRACKNEQQRTGRAAA